MKEVLRFYSIRWYWIPLLLSLFILNRIVPRSYPWLSLSPVINKDISMGEVILEILLKGSFLGLLLFLLPGQNQIPTHEKFQRAWTAGLVIWFFLFYEL